jgi:AcrR family transcriptional regulator
VGTKRARGPTKPAKTRDLDSNKIADAALALVDAHGVAGFTMRAVAEALGVTPMALYHHVPDKAALAALVVDRANATIPFPEPTGDWREDAVRMAQWSRRSIMAHPNADALRRMYRIWTPAVLQMIERWVSLWAQSGLPLKAALHGARMSSSAINGTIEHEITLRRAAFPDKAQLATLPNARLLFAASSSREHDFETTVRALIDGLHGRLGG